MEEGNDGEGVRVRVGQHVMRARVEVEVEGSPEEIGAVLDDVLASVAKHFEPAPVEPAASTDDPETQDVPSRPSGSSQDVVVPEVLRRAA